jgi:hypothetical protein
MQRTLRIFLFFCSLTGCSDDAATTPTTTAPDAGSADAGGGDDGGGGMRSTGLPVSCTRKSKVTTTTGKCNGEAAFCAKTYDRVVTPMTHNAHSLSTEKFGVFNQTQGIAKQLDDGIRGMMLDTYYFDSIERVASETRIPDLGVVDQAYLCHGPCTIGNARLIDKLCIITDFLDAHPEEVLSIIFENHIADADTAALLEASGLDEYVYTHAAGTPWPTLGELVNSKKRLVTFVEKGGGTPAYLHPAWTGNVWDTPYTFAKVEDFTCKLNRGATTNPLFLINHWLDPPAVAKAQQVNVTSVLGARVEKCTTEAGRPPTFVGVDFYDVGDLFSVVKKANGL